jgi:C-terminal processing protease CtpA/Prc
MVKLANPLYLLFHFPGEAMSTKTVTRFSVLILLIVFLSACGQGAPSPTSTKEAAQPTTTSLPPAPTPSPTHEPNHPVQLSGQIEVSNALIIEVYFYERFVMLEDLTGFVQRDYEYEQPLEAQILGPVEVQEKEEGQVDFTYTLHLPAQPAYPLNDVDNDGEEDQGLQIWQIIMTANYIDDPFLGEDETGGWSSSYTSAKIDAENKNEIIGGEILVWAPDGDQSFPTGFGEDGLLFTEDDPVGSIPAGYTLVNLDEDPFEIYKETQPTLKLYEGDIAVNDYSDMGWSEAFQALHQKVSREYPFNEIKDIDWGALYEEYAPQIEDAEEDGDEVAYYLTLRDYSWSIPDGHVGIGIGEIGNQMFMEETEGGFGFAIMGLDDGRVIAHVVLEEGPAVEAGMVWGAEILEWNQMPIQDALSEVTPWSMPHSTEHSLRIQQYRYLLRAPVGTEAEVTFQNPGAGAPITVSLSAVPERETFTATSVFAGFDLNGLPVEYEILDSGYGYIKISSLSEDINLIIRLWEYALTRMIENQVPALIIDMRQNTGGSPLGSFFAGYFVEERIDLNRTYYYSEKTGEFETYGPPDYTEPDDDLYYEGQLGVLVSPGCMSACEDVAWTLSQLEQTRVFGYYSSDGIYGEVARGQYLLPGGYNFQAPTGMTKDMDGNITIEGMGVVPDVHVPVTEETMHAEYVEGEDVVLNHTIEVIDQPLGAGITPESSPTIGSKSESEAALNAGTPWLEDLVREYYDPDELSQAGQTYTFTVPLNRSQKVMWVYAWCTGDQESLTDNWSKIQLAFELNGEEVPLDDFAILEVEFSGSFCRAYYTVLSDWAVGEHILTTTVTFTAPLNDGITEEDYPAGTHVYEYHVYIAR